MSIEPGTKPPSESITMALLAHLLGIFTSFVGPLVIWLVKKEDPFVNDQAKEALNFQITICIGYAIGTILVCFVIGYFIWLGLWVVSIIFGVMGTIAASKGERYRYPWSLRLIQ